MELGEREVGSSVFAIPSDFIMTVPLAMQAITTPPSGRQMRRAVINARMRR